MAESSYRRSLNPGAIIHQWFCAPDSLHLTRNNGVFTGVGRNVKYEFTFNGRHIFLKADRNPLLTLQHNIETQRWEVFRGQNRLFSVDKSPLQSDVFLAENIMPDFRIEGNWFDQSCIIYRVNGNRIIAENQENNTMTVYPNEDCAFIVALVVVLEEIDPYEEIHDELEEIHDEGRHHHLRP